MLKAFTPRKSSQGYLLLRIIRIYLELDMRAALTTHTEVTIAEGKKEMLNFKQLVKVSSGLFSSMPQHGCVYIYVVGI